MPPPADATAPLAAALDRDLAPGTQVGEYLVEERLGAGAFGVVYRVHHPLIGKAAAVKVLGREYSAKADMVSRFLAEARAVNTIRHPNIVDIFNFGTLDDGRLYYVMELLEGGTLAARIAERGRIDPPALCRLLRGVAGALDAAHRKGIIHRDLKPENVFLAQPGGDGRDESTVAKLLDFGVAKLTAQASSLGSHLTRTGAPIGTPHFMSPEQCLGFDVDYRSDIYSLGVMCFEALTGRLPFDGQSMLELMNKHTLAERPAASALAPGLGPAIDEALRRMMHIDPEQRPKSAGEALGLLERASGGPSHAATLADGTRSVPASPPMVEELGEAPTERARLSQLTVLESVTTQPGTSPQIPAITQGGRRTFAALVTAVVVVVAVVALGFWLARGPAGLEPSNRTSAATPDDVASDESSARAVNDTSSAAPIPTSLVVSSGASAVPSAAAVGASGSASSTEAISPGRRPPGTASKGQPKPPPATTATKSTPSSDPWGTR